FFFQAEDGIRDRTVTRVQTCALPIFNTADPALEGNGSRKKSPARAGSAVLTLIFGGRSSGCERKCSRSSGFSPGTSSSFSGVAKIGRASCRERVEGVGVVAAVMIQGR